MRKHGYHERTRLKLLIARFSLLTYLPHGIILYLKATTGQPVEIKLGAFKKTPCSGYCGKRHIKLKMS